MLAKCQSLKLECEHKGGSCSTMGSSQPGNFLQVSLSNSPGRPGKNHELTLPVECEIHHPSMLSTLPCYQPLCHILSLQPPDPTHFTPQSSLITERSSRNVMTSLTHTWHSSSSHSKAHGDSRAPHVPGAKQLNPVSQERRR